MSTERGGKPGVGGLVGKPCRLGRPMRFALFVLGLLIVVGMAVIGCVTQPFVTPVSSRVPAVEEQRLRSIVEHLSETLHPRSFDHHENLQQAGWYIRDAFLATGARVTLQEFTVQGEHYFNVVASFGPSDGALTIVGAHYDSNGDAWSEIEPDQANGLATHTPGADDNASGVAGLLELAHLLGAHPPPRPVRLVAYTLEEPPHFQTEDMGSARHARSLTAGAEPVELMIALEMIGYFNDAANSQRFPIAGLELLYPSTGNFIAIVSRPNDWRESRALKSHMRGASELPVFSINVSPWVPGVDFSDHLNYWAEGIPAMMVTDTAFYRNDQYHQLGDVAGRLDYRRMAHVVQGVFAFVTRPAGR